MIAFFRSVRCQLAKRDISCSLAGSSLSDISCEVLTRANTPKTFPLFSSSARSAPSAVHKKI